MKKTKFGLAALAAALVFSFAASNSDANVYYTGRAGTAPNYVPAGNQINKSDCEGSGLCGYEFTSTSGGYVGEIPGQLN